MLGMLVPLLWSRARCRRAGFEEGRALEDAVGSLRCGNVISYKRLSEVRR